MEVMEEAEVEEAEEVMESLELLLVNASPRLSLLVPVALPLVSLAKVIPHV